MFIWENSIQQIDEMIKLFPVPWDIQVLQILTHSSVDLKALSHQSCLLSFKQATASFLKQSALFGPNRTEFPGLFWYKTSVGLKDLKAYI